MSSTRSGPPASSRVPRIREVAPYLLCQQSPQSLQGGLVGSHRILSPRQTFLRLPHKFAATVCRASELSGHRDHGANAPTRRRLATKKEHGDRRSSRCTSVARWPRSNLVPCLIDRRLDRIAHARFNGAEGTERHSNSDDIREQRHRLASAQVIDAGEQRHDGHQPWTECRGRNLRFVVGRTSPVSAAGAADFMPAPLGPTRPAPERLRSARRRVFAHARTSRAQPGTTVLTTRHSARSGTGKRCRVTRARREYLLRKRAILSPYATATSR